MLFKNKHSFIFFPCFHVFYFRNARLSFQHACGTNAADGKPCNLQVQAGGINGTDVAFDVPENLKFNNGSLGDVKVWPWQDVKLPILNFNDKVQFYSKFDPNKGGVNLDNIHLHTRQK